VLHSRTLAGKAKNDFPETLESFTPDKCRNFCIIAHVDHGKTTLSNRFMELTGVLERGERNELFLDNLQVEKERGITVRAQTATMVWKGTLLNLVDTPGHVDFCAEVARAVQASEAALLLVDAAQGLQAQSLANLFLALDRGLHVQPVLNKVDLALSRGSQGQRALAECEADLRSLLGWPEEDDGVGGRHHLPRISAKTGEGVEALLDHLVQVRRQLK
jgi:GTP-binding protein LepA